MATQDSSYSRPKAAFRLDTAPLRVSVPASPSTGPSHDERSAFLRAQQAGPASFSPDRKYRYSLWRTWDPHKPALMVIGLNPSTADESKLDPTLKRCVGFAHSWGYGGFVMANLFAFRATDPLDMKAAFDPIGPDNDTFLTELAFACKLVLAAWGTHGGWLGRDQEVIDLLTRQGVNLACLALTKHGYPKHPLYMRGKDPTTGELTRPMVFRRGSVRR